MYSLRYLLSKLYCTINLVCTSDETAHPVYPYILSPLSLYYRPYWYVCICVCVCVCVCACVCVCVCVYVCLCLCACECLCAFRVCVICTYICICTCVNINYVCMYINVHT